MTKAENEGESEGEGMEEAEKKFLKSQQAERLFELFVARRDIYRAEDEK